ncbi:hypothetical protein AB1L88_16390 [Tautonia sp. JC769]|uniref:hypothetical protein n=1 Tax=Tautonia sp. JC769 TaxID=3232135 RepID=UPI00345A3D1D
MFVRFRSLIVLPMAFASVVCLTALPGCGEDQMELGQEFEKPEGYPEGPVEEPPVTDTGDDLNPRDAL